MAVRLPLLPRLLLLLLVLVALVFAGFFLFRPTAAVALVQRGKAPDARPGSVVVYAEYWLDVKSELGGRVASSRLDAGKRFARDEVMLQIDPRDLDLEIEKIEADFEATKRRIAIGSTLEAEMLAAEERMETLVRMQALGQVSEQEIINHRRSMRGIEQRMQHEALANEKTLADFENLLKVKRLEREKMTVRAPFEGVVSEVLAWPGELLGPGSPVARLISSTRTVEARISEENFAGIKPGQKASVRFLGYGAQLYGASVAKVLPVANPETQRYSVHLNVDLPVESLVPGITGEVSIVVAERENTLIMPRRALFGNHVYLVENGRVHLRPVKVGFTALNYVEVLEGVEEGDAVIVDQLDLFRDGDRVRTRVEEVR